MNLIPALLFVKTWVASRVAERDETGATAVEYGMLVGLIAAILVTTIGLLGGEILGAFDHVVDSLTGSNIPAAD